MSQDCGCGRPAAPVPAPTDNRPGLPALRYRAGTHATFLQALLEGISSVTIPVGDPPDQGEARPLAALTVRDTGDASVAMLDAWATVADVLTFYQERIANEGYLRTATERRSLVELARLTGYRPRPGVAAAVHLAFDLDDGYRLDLPVGTRAMSIPAPGETMEAFETGEELHARAEWNRLIPRASVPAVLLPAERHCELYLQGITTGVSVGDLLLLDFTTRQTVHRVMEVHPDFPADRTRVVLYCPPMEEEDVAEVTIPEDNSLPVAPAEGQTVGMTRTAEGTFVGTTKAATQTSTATVSAQVQKGMVTNVASVQTAAVVGVLQTAADALARSRVKGSTAEARNVLAEVETLGAAGETVALPDVERAINTVAAATDTVAGKSATLDKQLDAAHAELTSLAETAAAADGTGMDAKGGVTGMQDSGYKPPTPGATTPTNPTTPPPVVPGGGTGPGNVVAQPLEDASGLSSVLGNKQMYVDPSRAPRSAAQLGRTHTAVLAAGGVTAPNLLAAFNPKLGSNLYRAWSGYRVPVKAEVPGAVYVFRVKAAPFGATAPPPSAELDDQCRGRSTEWYLDECDDSTGNTDRLTLDGVYDRILPGSWVAVRTASDGETRFYRALEVETVARNSYGLGGRATRLTLDRPWLTCWSTDYSNSYNVGLEVLRDMTVYAQAEPLVLARQPVTADVQGQEIELDRLYDGLTAGRWVIVSGERTDLAGVTAAELAMITGVRHGAAEITLDEKKVALPGDHVHTWITLSSKLAFSYRRSTLQIFGNVAAATHGETREQVLGSGDGSKPLQRFQLMQGPLTYVPAATTSGIASTLVVRVDRVRWDEAPNLAALGPQDREYLVQIDHEGKTHVTFGDGVRGARLPTGNENVRAVYRTGIGAPGNVDAGQISLLATRPQGLKGVVNPLASSGGGDPDTAEQIRRNAPLGLLALDRIVSVEDYTDFVRGFAGIGKAQAAFLTDGRRPVVHITFAGVNDEPIGDESALAAQLQAALRRYGDPHRYLDGGPRDLRALVVSARILVRPDVLWEDVEPRVRAAMLEHFAFDRRELGQGVAASEVVAVLQGAWGVQAVDLELLASIGEAELLEDPDALSELAERGGSGDGDGGGHGWVPSRMARVETRDGKRRIVPAQLVILTPAVPDTLILTEWKR
ncbi:MAG TPA: putative baseplate assembly protein [Longimicrobium sp.]|nr:putative baseplate assembly protein [Longimicrobium sp.]